MAAMRPKILEPSFGADPWNGAIGEVAAGEELVDTVEMLAGAVPLGTIATEV